MNSNVKIKLYKYYIFIEIINVSSLFFEKSEFYKYIDMLWTKFNFKYIFDVS